MKERVDWIIRGAGQMATLSGPAVPRRGSDQAFLGLVEKAGLAIRGERIVACGPEAEILSAFEGERSFDAEGGVVLPGFVDPHTHLLFVGSREKEFELRCQGRSYLEIAAAGGGIRSSVRAFRGCFRCDPAGRIAEALRPDACATGRPRPRRNRAMGSRPSRRSAP